MLHLSLACGDYELTRPLIDGIIKPEGIELTCILLSSPERHWRMSRHQEFDICEFSLSSYLIAKIKEMSLKAIPVFLHRRFRHSFIFINKQAGIKKPKDLEGKRIGLRTLQNTAALWMRGILQHYYGVSLNSISWFTQDEEPIPLLSSPKLTVQRVPSGKNVDAMLIEGELEAVIYPETLPSFKKRNPNVGLLFKDYKKEEIKYYQETGLFPIMHTVVIKDEILHRYPWVAVSMLKAFREAKRICYKRIENPRTVPIAWMMHSLEEQKEILGNDPWPYNLPNNYKNLETFITYSYEQGIIDRKVKIEELFAKSSLDESPAYVK